MIFPRKNVFRFLSLRNSADFRHSRLVSSIFRIGLTISIFLLGVGILNLRASIIMLTETVDGNATPKILLELDIVYRQLHEVPEMVRSSHSSKRNRYLQKKKRLINDLHLHGIHFPYT